MIYSFLADTNLWLRAVDTLSPQQQDALSALESMSSQARLTLVPQNLIEFWAVATRPREANGLGWTTVQAAERLGKLCAQHELIAENHQLFETWLAIVKRHEVKGKRVHDARIAAAVIAFKIDYLVTFNLEDFQSWGINAVQPGAVGRLLLERSQT